MGPEESKSSQSPSKALNDGQEEGTVHNIRETDPDEQRKKFKSELESAEQKFQEAKLMMQEAPLPKAPTPFESNFHAPPPSSTSSAPSFAPPPAPPQPEEEAPIEEDDDLPESPTFWHDIGIGDNEPLPKPNIQPQPLKQETKPAEPKLKKGGPTPTPPTKTPADLTLKSEQKALPSPPHSQETKDIPRSQKSLSTPRSPAKKEPSSSLPAPPTLPNPTPFAPPTKETAAVDGATPPHPLVEETYHKAQRGKERDNIQQDKAQERTRRQSDRDRAHRIETIASPTYPPLPAEIVPIAEASAQRAAPHLPSEMMPLFYSMVGHILIVQKTPGVTTTEFQINAPSMQSSKFFGATISIEKYDTAPDSFNIRLSGSSQAVAAFQKHLPNLTQAFANGRFSFRIGRLEAVYTTEKPLFRRKERGEERDSQDGNQSRR
jgi:hypothetical protein